MTTVPAPFSATPGTSAAGRRLHVLVTGFEPFGGSPLNPSTVVAERLGSERLHGAELRTAVLPVVGGHGPGSARAALDAEAQREQMAEIVRLLQAIQAQGR
jgi:pyrrolidone-carboxylate peptidase